MTFIEFCEAFIERPLFEHEKKFAKFLEEHSDEKLSQPIIARGAAKTSYREQISILFALYRSSKGEKKDENNMTVNVDLNDIERLMEDEDMKISKCELAYKFNSDVEIEELSEENALILNDYTEEEFGNLFQELLKNAYESSQNNPNSLIGMLAQYAMFLSGLSSVTPNGTR